MTTVEVVQANFEIADTLDPRSRFRRPLFEMAIERIFKGDLAERMQRLFIVAGRVEDALERGTSFRDDRELNEGPGDAILKNREPAHAGLNAGRIRELRRGYEWSSCAQHSGSHVFPPHPQMRSVELLAAIHLGNAGAQACPSSLFQP